MPDSHLRPQLAPDAFAAILAADELPLIVGGQAVNLWAEIYATEIPKLQAYAPFTSVDADIYGTRALAETLARRAGWDCRPSTERASIAVAILTKATSPGQHPLTIEVLNEVNGLSAADLTLSTVVELTSGERYRIPPPVVLLKAKLYNLISLVDQDRPQDLKHARMLMQIVPQRFNELWAEHQAGDVTVEDLVASIDYARDVAQSDASANAARIHGFDYRELLPASFLSATGSIQDAVQSFLDGLPPSSAGLTKPEDFEAPDI